MMQLQNLLWDN